MFSYISIFIIQILAALSAELMIGREMMCMHNDNINKRQLLQPANSAPFSKMSE